jgi:FO synthase subunit 1
VDKFDQGEPAYRLRTVSYSPAYTLVPTYECFNRCAYCNFRQDPDQDAWLSLSEAETTLRSLPSVIEILILSGEVHPQSVRRADWVEHLYNLCDLALSLGFLPHTNAGPLSFTEMERLKGVNVSMGLMLEQMTPSLLQTVHRFAPSKVPELRWQQLMWAGELQIPFTTGLLLGIGETEADREQTLEAIAEAHQQWGHIQEVILQPYSPGKQETWAGVGFSSNALVDLVAKARGILSPEIALQVPPNLIQDHQFLLSCLDAGASDLGGIGPYDEVNPDYPPLLHGALAAALAEAGYCLEPRLPIYPQYDHWLSGRLKYAVESWRSGMKV